MALREGEHPDVAVRTPAVTIPVMDADEVAARLKRPERLYERQELLRHPSPIPAVPGLYGWYFDTLPHPSIRDIGTVTGGWSLLYIGIAPSGPPSRSNLRKRLRHHLSGNARGSTLRLTLGALLLDALELEPSPASGRLSFGPTEHRLSAWLDEHTRVVWVEHPQPWAVEAEVVRLLVVPLNRQHNAAHQFHETLWRLRSSLRNYDSARGGEGA